MFKFKITIFKFMVNFFFNVNYGNIGLSESFVPFGLDKHRCHQHISISFYHILCVSIQLMQKMFFINL